MIMPFELQEIVRKLNNNPNLTDSGSAVVSGFTICLDGCMEWSSVTISNSKGDGVYRAYQHASNKWVWDIQKDELTEEDLQSIRSPFSLQRDIKEQAKDFGRLAGYVVVVAVAACLVVIVLAATMAFVRWVL